MADILKFPKQFVEARKPAAITVVRTVASYEQKQLTDAVASFTAAAAEISGMLCYLQDGETVDGFNPLDCGQTMEHAVTGMLRIINVRGATECDHDLSRALRLWLSRNGGDHG